MKINSKIIFLFLTILISAIFVWPELNYQDLLSQGDHGRDLYASDMVTHGKMPYKDFWWVYGPLMPYYYGLFFKIFGVHISTMLLGRAMLVLVLSVFFYLSATCIMAPSLAFLASIWFTQGRPEFFFTYNHIGGIACELIILWCLLSYIQFGTQRYLLWALLADFILGLIKINFGLAGLLGIIISVFTIDYAQKYAWDEAKKKFYLTASVAIPAALGIIYWALLKDLPFYAVRQCMPYFGDDQPHHATLADVLPYYFMQHWLTFIHTPLYMVIGIVLHGCTLATLYFLFTNKFDDPYKKKLLLTLGMIWLFFVLYFNEFIVSGVWYRSYWSLPFLEFFQFVTIAAAFTFIPKFLRILIVIFLGGLTLLGIVAHIGMIESQKQPFRYLSMDRGHVYVGNEPQWTDTVNEVTLFLNKSLKPEDKFFAVPYDCLYYYLTGKESPTRQLIFFDHIKIPQEQELTIIKELLGHNTRYVLMSNRIASKELGLGIFGKTYCPVLAQFINQNFMPFTRQGGDWNAQPGWANNHGVLLLKRK